MEESRLLNSYLHQKKNNKLSKVFRKILCSIIFLLSSLIFTSLSDNNLVLYKKYVLEESFDFMKFKNLYDKISLKKDNKDVMVFANFLEYTDITAFKDGQKLSIGSDVPIKSLAGGIVVFAGEKEDFGKTIIIQGSDGYDIWYAFLDTIDIKLYDYINSGSLIALASDEIYLQITKDGKYFTYDEYQNQI